LPLVAWARKTTTELHKPLQEVEVVMVSGATAGIEAVLGLLLNSGAHWLHAGGPGLAPACSSLGAQGGQGWLAGCPAGDAILLEEYTYAHMLDACMIPRG
jgi:DNA-binding transcriptional MocR family regulator